MPRVETHIIAEGDPMGGIGEPGTPPIAPAVCNAILQADGQADSAAADRTGHAKHVRRRRSFEHVGTRRVRARFLQGFGR